MTVIIDKIQSLKKYVKTLFRTFLIKLNIFKILLRIRTKFRLFLWKAEYIFFHAVRRKKTVCILTKKASNSGLFAIFRQFLGGIAYADRMAMIPVVDMKSHINAYLYEKEVGHINAWEYYFEQPAGISLDDVSSYEKTVSLEVGLYPIPRQDLSLFYNEDGKLDYWRGLCKKYIRLSPAVLERIEREKQKFTGKRVLGVSLRGTDYISLQLHDHPIQPDADMALAKAKEVMNERNYDALYLSTEDKKIVERFKEVLGEKLILPDSEYVDFDYTASDYITEYTTNRENDKYLMGLEYVVSKLLLRECKGVIMSITNGTATMMCLSEGFEYMYIFDLGFYK